MMVAVSFQVVCINANVVTFIELGQLCAFVNKSEWADVDLITHLEQVIGNQLSIDVDVVGTSQIVNTIGAALAKQACMMRGYLRVGQHNGIICIASDGDFRSAEFDRTHRWQVFLYSSPIAVGERHERTALLANTENIAMLQRLAERFITPDLASLIEQTIQCGLAFRMRVDKDELVALAYNLDVLAGDGALADNDIGRGIAPDIDNGLVEGDRFPVSRT